MNHVARYLNERLACHAAVVWIERLDPPMLQAAWDVCHRGDWMAWLLRKHYVCALVPHARIPLFGEMYPGLETARKQFIAGVGDLPSTAQAWLWAAETYANRIRAVYPVCPVPEPHNPSTVESTC